MSLKGVADVNVFGGHEKRLEILLNKNIFMETELSLSEILFALNSVNLKILGTIEATNQEINVICRKICLREN